MAGVRSVTASLRQHDWAGLARALRGVAPEIAKGEMPSDPDLLRAYLEALEALRDLAEEVGTPATVKEAAARRMKKNRKSLILKKLLPKS